MFLYGYEQLANVDALQTLGGLTALQSLRLQLFGCSYLPSKLQCIFRSKDDFVVVVGA